MDYKEEGTEIKSICTEQTGGNVYNDIITLDDDTIVVITCDAIYYFEDREHYNNGETEKIIYR